MLFLRYNKNSSLNFHKKAPNLCIPFSESRNISSGIIKGYCGSSDKEYARALIDKYPLCNE